MTIFPFDLLTLAELTQDTKLLALLRANDDVRSEAKMKTPSPVSSFCGQARSAMPQPCRYAACEEWGLSGTVPDAKEPQQAPRCPRKGIALLFP